MPFFTEVEKSILKFIWKNKRLQVSKAVLSKKEQCWAYHKLDFKLDYKAIVTKTAYYWHKNSHKDQWNRIKTKTTTII
jgi:hypothetical protein